MSVTEASSGFSALPDQGHPVKILKAILEKGNIPHALLFTGIAGVGKLSAAMTFAMACNCTGIEGESPASGFSRSAGAARSDSPGAAVSFGHQAPCSLCRPCRKIASGNHPDIIFLKPSGNLIKIASVRELCRRLQVKPHEARNRVILIQDAHTMNKEAANALLKVLEEPPERTIFILTATAFTDLLPTIVSRCLQIRFNPISPAAISSCLVNEHRIAEADARALGAMAEGSITRALSMHKRGWPERRRWLTGEIDALGSMSLGRLLAFSEKLAGKKELVADSLDIIKNYLRDLLIFPLCPEKIINRDLEERIRRSSQAYTADSIISKIDAVQRAQKELRSNSNLRLTLEVLIMRLSRV